MDKWWPPGHILGYEPTFIHTIADFVKAVVAAGRSFQPSSEGGLRGRIRGGEGKREEQKVGSFVVMEFHKEY